MADLKLLTFDDILAAEDNGETEVPISDWGGSVRIRPLTMEDIQVIRKRSQRPVPGSPPGTPPVINDDMFQQFLVCAALVRPKVDSQKYGQLLKKKAGALQKIVSAILESSGLTSEQLEAAKQSFREGFDEEGDVSASTLDGENG